MTPPADYHLHTPLCRHAEGSPEQMVAAARAAGLVEMGISDHSPMREAFDDWRMDWAEFPAYCEWVERARAAGGASLPVRLGLEVDYLEGGEAWIEELAAAAEFDYLIGSVHYLDESWAVDDPRLVDRIGALGVEETWDRYWALFTKAIRSGFFDFVGHPDLVKKFGHWPTGDLRRYYEPAIEALVEGQVAFEINTAGWHKDCAEAYPARGFLELAAEAGVGLVISSDAHRPGEVARDFDRARRLAAECGFQETLRFERRAGRAVPL